MPDDERLADEPEARATGLDEAEDGGEEEELERVEVWVTTEAEEMTVEVVRDEDEDVDDKAVEVIMLELAEEESLLLARDESLDELDEDGGTEDMVEDDDAEVVVGAALYRWKESVDRVRITKWRGTYAKAAPCPPTVATA